jgi:HEAT repeat protein
MKQWLRVLAVLALVILFFITSFIFRPATNPVVDGRLASQWVNDLLSAEYQVRNEAQTALRVLGEQGVPQICVLLRTGSAAWEPWITRASSFLPFLELKPRDAVLCRQRAAEMIAILGVNGSGAVPDLIDVLPADKTAAEVERALVRVGTNAVPPLVKSLRHRHAGVRERAARLLQEFETMSAETTAGLIERRNDSSAKVREQVARALGRSGLNQVHVIDTLLSLSTDPTPEVRAAAFESLGAIGLDSAKVFDSLHRGLRDRVAVVRLNAAKALWKLEKNAEVIVPVLTEILQTAECWQAAYALGQMRSAAAPAIPELIRVLRFERVPRPFRTPPSSAFALGQIGPAAIPAVSTVLTDPEPRARLAAVMAFGFMGREGRPAVSRLLRLLEDENAEIRHATALTLAAIGAEPDQIVAGLSDCLRAEDIYMRSAAAAMLQQIEPGGNWVALAE